MVRLVTSPPGQRNMLISLPPSGLVDFEMWQPFSSSDASEMSEKERTEELQKWGLAHRPPAKNWWAEFGIETR
jgi:hypothetical protein